MSAPPYAGPGGDAGDGDGDASPDAASDLIPTPGARSRTIVIGSAFTADIVSQVQVAIELRGSQDFAVNGNPDGSDLLVVDDSSDDGPLAHEIEHLDTTTGDLLLWVRLEDFAPGGKTLRLFYGGARATLNDPTQVFDGLGGAQMVWHFGGETGDLVLDSGARGPHDALAPTRQREPGAFGDGLRLEAFADVRTASSPQIYPGIGDWTLSFWTKPPARNGLAAKLGSVAAPGSFGVEVSLTPEGWELTYQDPNRPLSVIPGTQAISTTDMQQVAVSVSRSAAQDIFMTVNGVEGATLDTVPGSGLNGSDPLLIGNNVQGIVDEVRIYNRRRTADKLRLERENAKPDFQDLSAVTLEAYPSGP